MKNQMSPPVGTAASDLQMSILLDECVFGHVAPMTSQVKLNLRKHLPKKKTVKIINF